MAEARARPKEVSVGRSGVGSHTHLSLVALFHAGNVEVNEIPFAAAQVVPSLMGGHADKDVQLPAALAGQVKQGSIRLLAVLDPESRPQAMPDVPIRARAGILMSPSRLGAGSRCPTARRRP